MKKTSNSPYQDMKHNFMLSAEAGTFGNKLNKTPMVTRVAVVGALFDKDYTLYPDDRATVLRALKVLRETHIKLAQIIEFDFYNLLAPLKNDFLRAAITDKIAPPADLVIVCGVWGGRSTRNAIDYMRPEQINTPVDFRALYSDLMCGYEHNRETSISALQSKETNWPEAAHAVGAKFVITRGPADDMDAVNSNHFKPGDYYKVAIPTTDKFEHVSGSIGGPLGIMVRRDALDEIKSTVKRKSPLGKRILELTDAPNEKPPPIRGPEDIYKELLALAEQHGIDLKKHGLTLK